MKCPSCGHENPETAKFCVECGVTFMPETPQNCPNCGTELPTGAKFCSECGHRLGEALPTPTPTQRTPEPTSFASGRYQVKRFLGEGGKKKVYLAHDSLLDRDVAFALIKTEGLDEVSRTRITREAQAMGRTSFLVLCLEGIRPFFRLANLQPSSYTSRQVRISTVCIFPDILCQNCDDVEKHSTIGY